MTSMADGPHPPVLNGELDGMKSSPANGPGTPRDEAANGALQDYGAMATYGAPQPPENNVSGGERASPRPGRSPRQTPAGWQWSPPRDAWE